MEGVQEEPQETAVQESTTVTLFDRFWSAYPRRAGKGAAEKAWQKLKPDDDLTHKIILAIDAQKRHRRRVEDMNKGLGERFKKWIPDWKHPSTWLNQQCWLDELPSLSDTRSESDEQKELCPKCAELGKRGYEYKHEQNPEKLCSWHFSEKHYNDGPTGINQLRVAYKQRIPRREGESVIDYLRRTVKAKTVGRD